MYLSEYFLDLLFPPKCVFCHRILEGTPGDAPYTGTDPFSSAHSAFSYRIRRKTTSGTVRKTVCPACRNSLLICQTEFRLHTGGEHDGSVDVCYAPLDYRGTVRDSLHRYKFGGNRFYAATYADIICKAFNNGELFCDIITWIPLARGRLRERGYDQAKLLAEELSRRTGIPCRETLVKQKNIRPQSSMKSAGDRLKNISGVYRPAKHCEVTENSSIPADAFPQRNTSAKDKVILQGKTVLLVDDIITTGATLSEAASVLKNCGAAKIIAAAVARAGLDDEQ